jgi:energy-coupling factor transporter transmembrane protein EcfT
MLFLLRALHPAARILFWGLLAIGVQALPGLPVAIALLALLLLSGGFRLRWYQLVRRARWLLLSLWLIMAYGLPGDGIGGFSWLPPALGVAEASLHVARLLLLLGTLAGLLAAASHNGLMRGLWGLFAPLRGIGFPAERSVARLALVLEYCEKAPPGHGWRQWLEGVKLPDEETASISVELPAWRPFDIAALVVAGTFLGYFWL